MSLTSLSPHFFLCGFLYLYLIPHSFILRTFVNQSLVPSIHHSFLVVYWCRILGTVDIYVALYVAFHDLYVAISRSSISNHYHLLMSSLLEGHPPQIPHCSFPSTSFPSRQSESEDDIISTMLVNSDSQGCNESLSIYIKYIIDTIYGDASGKELHHRTYHNISIYALKLLNLNLFVKNYHFCIGKILAFLSTFTALTDAAMESDGTVIDEKVRYEGECLKEFLCIVVLLLLKIKNNNDDYNESESLQIIDTEQLYKTLEHFEFITVISKFIATHVVATDTKDCSFVLLKFGCDIAFEYLFHKELLSDNEFTSLTTETSLIPTLIKYLLSNENFNAYDIDGDDFEDEDKLIAYEEFKLLLLVNEQYLMKSYSCDDVQNKVFDMLMNDDKGPNNSNITGFINLLIYHLNREESHIIKILILKFLYLVFTSSYTTKLVYLNDLKILVDIFIREINDLDYSADNEHKMLMITYLKVLYPLLMFSQLNEDSGYKKGELIDLLGNLILNSTSSKEKKDDEVVPSLAGRCMAVPWLKEKKKRPSNSSSSSLTSSEALFEGDLNTSSDSIAASFTRVASVRASSRSDFYKHTTTHNAELVEKHNIFKENNNNLFLGTLQQSLPSIEEKKSNILDLPTEYLKAKPLPRIPALKNDFYKNDSGSSTSVNSASLLVRKALKKKAPPPPPHYISEHPEHQEHQEHQDHKHKSPPPPPRHPYRPLEHKSYKSPDHTETKNHTPPPPPPRRRR